jgi:hypothetical protein
MISEGPYFCRCGCHARRGMGILPMVIHARGMAILVMFFGLAQTLAG